MPGRRGFPQGFDHLDTQLKLCKCPAESIFWQDDGLPAMPKKLAQHRLCPTVKATGCIHQGTEPFHNHQLKRTSPAPLNKQGVLQFAIVHAILSASAALYSAVFCPHILSACNIAIPWREGRCAAPMVQSLWRRLATIISTGLRHRAHSMCMTEAHHVGVFPH